RLLVRRDPSHRGRLRHARRRLQRDDPQRAAGGQARRGGLIRRRPRCGRPSRTRRYLRRSPKLESLAMAGSTPLFPLRTALLSTALVALLGACTPDRDAADGPTAADPASTATPAGQAADATAPTQPVDDAMATSPATDATDPGAVCNADGLQALVGQQATETLTAQATADSGATSVRVLGPTED